MNRPQHQYRVTKYDPALRSTDGTYPLDDWTSRSDIGKLFGGALLTEDSYLSTEHAYLQAASAFLAEAKILQLKIVGLENYNERPHAPSAGSTVESADVPTLLRSLLREEFWCKLEGPSSFIHVGYDYYMYVGVPHECTNASVLTRSLGLFVETFHSPYAENDA